MDRKVLSYADDLCILTDDKNRLQENLNLVVTLARKIGIKLKTSKCAASHLSGKTPVGCRDSIFYIENDAISQLKNGDSVKFLGKRVGYSVFSNWDDINLIISKGVKILTSRLAPRQRLDAMRTFFYPSMTLALRQNMFTKSDLKKVGQILRPMLKKTLNIPVEACNNYLYGLDVLDVLEFQS